MFHNEESLKFSAQLSLLLNQRFPKNYVTSTTSAKTIFLSAYHSFYLSNPEYEQALFKTVSFLIDQQKDVCIFAQTPPLESLLLRHLESTHLIKSVFPRHLKYSELFTFNQQYVEKNSSYAGYFTSVEG